MLQGNESVLELSENGRIKTFNKVGLTQIHVDRKEKLDTPFIPQVLTIYVTNFYSVYIEKSYTLLDMEIGQKYKLKVKIQHEFGLIFSESNKKILN